ncbi:hypothetical protein OG762_17600 [Streptomyces sp. NBC_01136]|uniref:hypothetical protein n=1 Tax=unclassified Streptomyces TaxID=2593676 RepID=UPI00324E7F67|nr:hypothetical protein OG762_17600 [Streptomyces sp. NBC_01136]
MSASERDVPAQQPRVAMAGVSMRDLLASCAAADAVSRPPRAPSPEAPRVAEQPRKAA